MYLSDSEDYDFYFNIPTKLQKTDEISLEVNLTREKFEEISKDLFEKCMNPVKDVLRRVQRDPRKIDGLVLIGGSSFLPKIRNQLKEITGKDAYHGVSPIEAVAYGACTMSNKYCEETLSQYRIQNDDSNSKFLTSFAVKEIAPVTIEIQKIKDKTKYYYPMIEEGAPLPCSKEILVYSNDVEYQKNSKVINIHVFAKKREKRTLIGRIAYEVQKQNIYEANIPLVRIKLRQIASNLFYSTNDPSTDYWSSEKPLENDSTIESQGPEEQQNFNKASYHQNYQNTKSPMQQNFQKESSAKKEINFQLQPLVKQVGNMQSPVVQETIIQKQNPIIMETNFQKQAQICQEKNIQIQAPIRQEKNIQNPNPILMETNFQKQAQKYQEKNIQKQTPMKQEKNIQNPNPIIMETNIPKQAQIYQEKNIQKQALVGQKKITQNPNPIIMETEQAQIYQGENIQIQTPMEQEKIIQNKSQIVMETNFQNQVQIITEKAIIDQNQKFQPPKFQGMNTQHQMPVPNQIIENQNSNTLIMHYSNSQNNNLQQPYYFENQYYQIPTFNANPSYINQQCYGSQPNYYQTPNQSKLRPCQETFHNLNQTVPYDEYCDGDYCY